MTFLGWLVSGITDLYSEIIGHKCRILLLVFFMLLNNTAYSKDEYIVGVVPQFDQRKIFQIWMPILSELELMTGLKFKLAHAKKIPDFERQYIQGEFDFAYTSPYFMLLGNRRQGYYPLVKDSKRKLNGIIVVRNDSLVKNVKQLDAEIIAFPSPNAVGASLMPRADLLNKFNIKFTPIYVQTHTSVYLNVIQGRAKAGGGVEKTLEQQPQALRDQLRILYKTKKINPHAFAAHARVPKEHGDLVRNALLEIGRTEQGQAMLRNIPIKQIGEAYMDDYIELDRLGLDKVYAPE